MTAKKTGATMGRPRKKPPIGAADKVRLLAADGHSLIGIAERLGVALDTFKRWTDEDPALQAALASGREKERFRLHNLLSKAADAGNITAMIFLLKAKHGYVEGQQESSSNKVSIVFQLPGAMQPEQFFTMENNDDRHSENLALPRTGVVRS
jgi:hypothetical protein